MCVHAELANMWQEKYVRRREEIKLNIGKKETELKTNEEKCESSEKGE